MSKPENLKFYEAIVFRENWGNRGSDIIVKMESEGDRENSASEVITPEVFVDPKHMDHVLQPEARDLRHVGFSVENLDRMLGDCRSTA